MCMISPCLSVCIGHKQASRGHISPFFDGSPSMRGHSSFSFVVVDGIYPVWERTPERQMRNVASSSEVLYRRKMELISLSRWTS
jgi:hypothetical protein